MNKLCWISTKIDNVLRKCLVFLMGLLLVDVCWQVITRFLLPQPSSYTEELARFLLIWIGLLGAAHAYRHGMHLGVDLFSRSLSAKKARYLNQVVQVVTFAFAASVLVYGGASLSKLAFDLNQLSAAMQINMGVVYLALPFSGLLFSLFAIEKFFTPLESTP